MNSCFQYGFLPVTLPGLKQYLFFSHGCCKKLSCQVTCTFVYIKKAWWWAFDRPVVAWYGALAENQHGDGKEWKLGGTHERNNSQCEKKQNQPSRQWNSLYAFSRQRTSNACPSHLRRVHLNDWMCLLWRKSSFYCILRQQKFQKLISVQVGASAVWGDFKWLFVLVIGHRMNRWWDVLSATSSQTPPPSIKSSSPGFLDV